jgi:hypothetical protein
MNRKQLLEIADNLLYDDLYEFNDFIEDIANLLEKYALMNQDDLDRGHGFNMIMQLIKQLRDENN